MDLMLHIPDDLGASLSAAGDIERQALEALGLESCPAGRPTKAELRPMLGIASRL